MIRTGSLEGTISYNPERSAKITAAFRQELGGKGISAAMREDDVVGYPSNIDSEGNYVVQVEQSDVSSKELKPGEIGYSDDERFKTSPQLITRKMDL